MAEKLDTPYNWELRTVYGIGHSGRQMAESGARYLLEGKAEEPLFPLKRDNEREPPAHDERTRELLKGSGDGEASPF